MKNTEQDIELAVFESVILGKSPDIALNILANYQCDDGGFGQLDNDIGYPYSCVKPTESACRHIFRLNPSIDHPIIKQLIPYLMQNYNHNTGEWNNLVVPEVNDYPHAPWWTYLQKTETIPENRVLLIEKYDPNTNAALAGIIYKYRDLVSDDMVNEIVSIPIEKVMTACIPSPYDMKSLLHFVDTLIDNELKNKLHNALLEKADTSMELDESKWNIECTMGPCNIITSPTHPFYEKYKDLVEHHLDYIIQAQQADGCWAPEWRWGELEYWKKAKKKLQMVLTLRNITVLKNFGRIENL